MIREYLAKRRYVRSIMKDTVVADVGDRTLCGPRKEVELWISIAQAAADFADREPDLFDPRIMEEHGYLGWRNRRDVKRRYKPTKLEPWVVEFYRDRDLATKK